MFKTIKLFALLLILAAGTAVVQAQNRDENVWYAEFYPRLYFGGEPVKQTITGQHLNLYWGFGKPDPNIPADFFSSRYRHYLTLDRPTRYRIVTRGDDGYRIWIDGKEIINQHSGTPFSRLITEVDLTAGRHAIYVEHYEMIGNAAMSIQLYPSGRPAQPPPTIKPILPITIDSFAVTPNPGKQGGEVTVSWRVRNATTLDVFNLVNQPRITIPVVIYQGENGEMSVQYTLDKTDRSAYSIFLLRAANDVESIEQTIRLPIDCIFAWYFYPDTRPLDDLGCSAQAAEPTTVIEQPFEFGRLIIFEPLGGTSSVLVFSKNGRIDQYDLVDSADLPATQSPPAGLHQPAELFRGVWEARNLHAIIGWATAPTAQMVATYWQVSTIGDAPTFLFGSADPQVVWVIEQRFFYWSTLVPNP